MTIPAMPVYRHLRCDACGAVRPVPYPANRHESCPLCGCWTSIPCHPDLNAGEEPAMPQYRPADLVDLLMNAQAVPESVRRVIEMWDQVCTDRDTAQKKLAQVEKERDERVFLRGELVNAQRERDVAQVELANARDVAKVLHSQVEALTAERDQARIRPSWVDHNKAVETLQRERDQLKEQVEGLTSERGMHAASAQKLQGDVRTYADTMEKIREALDNVGYGVNGTTRTIMDKINELGGDRHALKRDLATNIELVDQIRKKVEMVRQERDMQQSELARAVGEISRLRLDLSTAKRALAEVESRPPTVNEAGIILGELIRAKAYHERGMDVHYKALKEGLWERAFALMGEAMPMDLVCPDCGTQHIDQIEPDPATPGNSIDWTKRPHKTHLCAQCGTTWRPEERCYTVGVRQTKADAPPIGPVPEFITEALARQDTEVPVTSVTIPADHFDKLTKAYRKLDNIINAMGLPT
jgi:predicted  nucleic acid-binding Zn-ribbon protein